MQETLATADRPSALRHWLAVALVYSTLVGGLVGIDLLYEANRPQLTPFVLMRFLLLGTAALGMMVLGPRAAPAVFGLPPAVPWLCLAPLVGALGCAASIAWVRWSGMDALVPVPYVPTSLTWFGVVVSPLLVAYTEELVFRGVLWAGIERLSRSPIKPILQTSVLFALIHLVNARDGYQWLELPHRFLGGLLLGWLRWRSGSLWPSVHAHFVWLALANLA